MSIKEDGQSRRCGSDLNCLHEDNIITDINKTNFIEISLHFLKKPFRYENCPKLVYWFLFN